MIDREVAVSSTTATSSAIYSCLESVRIIINDLFSELIKATGYSDYCEYSYLHQGGYVFFGVSYLVCLLAGLRKNYLNDFHKIRWKGGTWTTEETVRFWW